MQHGPSTDWGEDKASAYKTRLGLWMFLVYFIVYAGFVMINSMMPDTMAKLFHGLNLAVVYGFGLIALALVMAFVYNALCGRAEDSGEAYTDDEQEEF
ncbi:MAG: DUF485 domain-containing protein [Armatimonadetes bacterium]|nr:DUF485 domain-containing protein [Armatimonadota bacterium]